jgi:hypothetical protein
MTSVKNFSEWSSLNEGRYDLMVGDMVSAVLETLKKSNTGEETYDGIKIRYTEKDDVPSFIDLIEAEEYLEVGDFHSEKTGVEAEVNLVLVRDEMPPYEKDFILDGHVNDEEGIIYVELSINPEREPECYNTLRGELRDLIRHEIEHLTQRGLNVKASKKIRRNDHIRNKIQREGSYHKYYKLKDEKIAGVQGLYARAKSLKKPFQEVAMDFLKSKRDEGIISGKEAVEIYNKWRKEIPKIGGIPNLPPLQ